MLWLALKSAVNSYANHLWPLPLKSLSTPFLQWGRDHPSYWQPGIVKNTRGLQGGSSRCQESQMQMACCWILPAVTPAMALLIRIAASLNESGMCNLHHQWLATYCTCLVSYSCAGKWCNRCLTFRHLPVWAGIIRGGTLQLFILFEQWSVTDSLYVVICILL